MALTHGFDILHDVRKMELEEAMLSDFYFLPREREVFSKPGTKNSRVAIVASAVNDRMSDYRFYENTTHNLGYRVKVFTGESEAEAWLEEKRE